MPLFQYKARGRHGDAIEGSMEAVSSDAVATQLINGGLTPIDIITARPKVDLSTQFGQWFPTKVKTVDLIQFSRQMHSLLKAGVPILNALAGLSSTTKNPTLAQAIREVLTSLEEGLELASACSRHPKIFSLFYVSMIRIGETTGQLDVIFLQLTHNLERDKKTRDQIKKAVRYPLFVMSAIVAAIAVINLMVIPAFAKMFAKFGAELPLPTRILLATSEFSQQHWLAMLLSTIALVVGINHYVGTENGRYRWDKMKLGIPLVGSIMYRATMARFSRLFAMSIRAGVPLITALTVVAKALDNSYVEQRVLNMQTGIVQGDTIAHTAATTGLFDSLVLQMIAVGEQTGSIDELLQGVAEYYDSEVEYDIDKLSASIEPILTVVIAGIVLVLALGVMLPMWDFASIALKH